MRHDKLHYTLSISLVGFSIVLALIFGALAPLRAAQAFQGDGSPLGGLSPRAYLPLVNGSGCAPIAGQSYATLSPTNPRGDDPQNDHLINLDLRGYEVVDKTKGLIGAGAPNDPLAPQFATLFNPQRLPGFSTVYALHKWDNGCNCPSPDLVTNPEVTVLGMATTPGEIIRTPDSGYNIGGNHDAMVLYADTTRIVLKYTREDDIVSGYTVYLEDVCVEPGLLTLYRQMHAAGRGQLPALTGDQPLGRAFDNEIGVSVRDSGSSQDPRSRNSWWLGY